MTRKTQYDYYDDSFKVTAVELGKLPGVFAKDVAQILDIHPIMLYRWGKELRDASIVNNKTKRSLDTEISCELKRLRKIRNAT